MNSFVINNVRIVTPYEVLENGFIYVRKGIIDVIELTSQQKLHRSCNVINGQGKWLFPGIVDMFSTVLGKEAESEENLPFPLETAFEALDSRLVSNGITTVYHAMDSDMANTRLSCSGDCDQEETLLNRLRKNGSIRHNLNILHDISEEKSFTILENMINRKELQLISILQKSGSRGSVRDRQLQKNELLGISEFIDKLAEKTRKYELRIASYGEGSYSRINHMKKLGIRVLEFPQSVEAAGEAAQSGMSVLLGAPDIIRSVLHDKKGNTLEAILNGSAHMLCSENTPASIINSMFLLHHAGKMDMAEAFRKVSINPAAALGIARRLGSIECGKYADLVLVREVDGKPFIEKVFINGFKVFEKNALIQSDLHFSRLVRPKQTFGA